MDLDIGLDLHIDDYELTNSSYQPSSATTSELGDAGSPTSSTVFNEDLTHSNNINIILKQCNISNLTSTLLAAPANFTPTSRHSLEAKQLGNSKRGPGRPRKDYPICTAKNINRNQTKKRLVKDLTAFVSLVPTSPYTPQPEIQASMGLTDDNSKQLSTGHLEELPYFSEKYPGKVCCLCNLCERSSLGQGDMLKLPINMDIFKIVFSDIAEVEQNASDTLDENSDGSCRHKNTNKQKVTINNELINELDNVGYEDIPVIENVINTGDLVVYIHDMCMKWALQMKRIDDDMIAEHFEDMLAKSLRRKCTYCHRYGASINCRMNCTKHYHLPCAAAASCFLVIDTYSAFCCEHIGQVPYMISDSNDVGCRQCCSLGEISKLLMCCTCGAHYHTNCVGLANFPDSRSGWNCQQCCKCLICRQTEGNDGRTVKCEQCQKSYHTTCLRPIISSVPKYGWKCNRCRVCSDCGARTPGAGASSRWHCHYSICDSCYQQRNKGFSCPICHKAYRAASYKEMVKCSSCNKFVHANCDDEADLINYHAKKDTNPEYEYVCPPCKLGIVNVKYSLASSISTSSDSIVLTADSTRDLDCELFDKDAMDAMLNTTDSLKATKKRFNMKDICRGGKMNKLIMAKSSLLNQYNRKRNVRNKARQGFLIPNCTTVYNGSDLNSSQGSEEDIALDKKMILCSANDKFVLMQDICVMCGAVGTDQEACLIACVQCGQCYHPYCANVTLSKTMLEKGWRCLDCTVCEGCGQKNDESRLILCDECDISYHIYCMSPPLDAVPNGNWKCKWCAVCQKCGRNSPGKNSTWFNGYLECGPCASQTICFACSQPYHDNELIIQCSSCERWLHCICDSIKNEEEAQAFNDIDYNCMICRSDIPGSSKSLTTGCNLTENNTTTKTTEQYSNNSISHNTSTLDLNDNSGGGGNSSSLTLPRLTFEANDNTFWIDGVCVSEHGFNMIRSLTMEMKRKRKLRSEANNHREPFNNTELLAAGNSTPMQADNAVAEANHLTVEKTPIPIYKDGMVWFGEDGSQPEGFSISTNDEGVNILRKKRQRNLQKLGIGGFNVRMRGLRKDVDEQLYLSATAATCSEQTTVLPDAEKKRKIIRKKAKSKLCETYPTYLQEAFFGKTLLNNKEQTLSFGETDYSDDSANLLNQINKKSPTFTSTTITSTTTVSMTTAAAVTTATEIGCNTNPKLFSDSDVGQQAMVNHVKIENSETNFNVQNNLLIDETMVAATVKLNHTSAISATHAVTAPTIKNEFGQNITLLSNNISSNPVINASLQQQRQHQILHQAAQISHVPDLHHLQQQQPQQKQPQLQALHIQQAHQQIYQQQQQQQQQPQQQLKPLPQHSPQLQEQQQQIHLQYQANFNQIMTANSNASIQVHSQHRMRQPSHHHQHQRQQQVQSVPQSPQPSQTSPQHSNLQHQHHQYFQQKNEDPLQSQIKIERDVLLSQAAIISSPIQQQIIAAPTASLVSSNAPQSAILNDRIAADDTVTEMSIQMTENVKETNIPGTQKTAEKMRKDEDLGEMATISAVLYANTQHPELKHMYPNWNERCKQILKKWRSLSTEMKAPFLQHAKENRSVLRLRRSQQEPDKIYFQQKTLKEQEQERAWKQHQAKTKEAYNNKINKNAFISGEYIHSEPDASIVMNKSEQQKQQLQQQQQPQSLFDMHLLDDNHVKLPADLLRSEENILNSALISNEQIVNSVSNSSKSLSQQPHRQLHPEQQLQHHHLQQQLQQKHQQQQQQNIDNPNEFINSLVQNVTQTLVNQANGNAAGVNGGTTANASTIEVVDDFVKTSLDNLKQASTDVNLHLSERSDIFMGDRSWTPLAKISEVKDSITSAVDKLEADENAGLGDILGGFGEGDDDDILKSLTAEIGDDFNILEYADPELDELTGSQNLLSKLDFDEHQKTI